MKKSALVIFIILAAVILFACQTSVPQAGSSDYIDSDAADGALKEYNYSIGLIQPGPEEYYQNYFNCIRAAAEHCGMKVTTLLTEYDPATEIANYEDLITKGVDAIACFSVNSKTAQIGAQLCNEEGIPLFLLSTVVADGPGKVTCTIGNSFYDMGHMVGEWVVDNMDGPQRAVIIEGFPEQGFSELISRGFMEACDQSARDDIVTVYKKPGNWDRADAIAIMEYIISSGLDFNLVFVHNEDMCAGVVSVLEENKLMDQVGVVTLNGSPSGIRMIKDGKVLASCANPPSYIAGDVVGQMIEYFDGEEMKEKIFYSPVFMLDSRNIADEAIVTWDEEWALKRVDDYRRVKED